MGKEIKIPNPEKPSPKKAPRYSFTREQLENNLTLLSPREGRVLQLRYGLNDGNRHTLEEIAQIFSVTRERIRQIEAKAIRKLNRVS